MNVVFATLTGYCRRFWLQAIEHTESPWVPCSSSWKTFNGSPISVMLYIILILDLVLYRVIMRFKRILEFSSCLGGCNQVLNKKMCNQIYNVTTLSMVLYIFDLSSIFMKTLYTLQYYFHPKVHHLSI